MDFTLSQQEAIKTFKEYLSSGNQVLILNGAAGTGKTTLIVEFLKILDAEKRICKLMAPTGRAACIISGKTGQSASTIHRGIYELTSLKSISQNKEEEDAEEQ